MIERPFMLAANLQIWEYGFLVIAAFLAGIVNTIAGGGSFLTLPAFLVVGIDPQLANATNRVAILLSSGSATTTFYRHGHVDVPQAIWVALPTLSGVPFGIAFAVTLPLEWFQFVFGCLFLLMAGVLASKPKRFLNVIPQSVTPSSWSLLAYFGIGIYVGFIQAGMGILLLLAMSFFGGNDLLTSNAIKNAAGFVVTLVGVIGFAVAAEIEWVAGCTMAVGNVLGGLAGARVAMLRVDRWIFFLLIVIMILTGLRLIFA